MTRPTPDPLKTPTPPGLWAARMPRWGGCGTDGARGSSHRASGTATNARRGSGCFTSTTDPRLLGWGRPTTAEPVLGLAGFATCPLTSTAMRTTQRLDFLVPVSDNDGLAFPEAGFAAFEDLLVDLAGGFTRHGDVTGAWRSPSGQLFRDRSRSYSVTVPADRAEGVAANIHRVVTDQFRQEAVMIEATPVLSAVF